MFYSALKSRVNLLHAHDMNSLPIVYVISKVKKVPFIYDSHEYWYHSHHGNYPQFVINLAAKLERYMAREAQTVITVSASIAKCLKEDFKNEQVCVIKNVPSYTHAGEYNLFREKYGIKKDVPNN